MKQNTFTKVFISVSVFTGLCWALAFGSAVLAGDKPFPKATLSKLEKKLNQDVEQIDQTKNIAVAGVTDVEIKAGMADIELATADVSDIQAHLTGNANKGTQIEMIQDKGKLTIQVENKNNTRWNFSRGVTVEKSLRLRVTLPKTYHSDLALKSGSGDIEAGELEVRKLEVKVGSGDVKLGGVKAKSAEAQSGSGNISLAKIATEDLQLATGSGDISVGELTSKNAAARAGSGDVVIKLDDFKNWTTTARTGSGDIEGNLPDAEKTEHPNSMKAGTGANRLTIETGSGDIKISI